MVGRGVLQAADIGRRGSFGVIPPQRSSRMPRGVFAWEGDYLCPLPSSPPHHSHGKCCACGGEDGRGQPLLLSL
jgi:hypothetical protein